MNELDDTALKMMLEGIIQPSGHPDPFGLLARILLTSGGNPHYVDVTGRMGLLPLKPEVAANYGISEVASEQGNLMAAITMDMQHFNALRNIQDMVVATHDGIEAVGSPSPETAEVLRELGNARQEVSDMLYPRLATVSDVFSAMTSVSDGSKTQLEQFKKLLGEVHAG